ncbi:NAD-dependent epimerase/dehydratase family protein [Streptomyces hoynatensis]|uniref:NAD-dependent epimerase/dehydratase family protein n=1 Tax=Streptomyces hoynatensis TaxID=1141874 RepID=A0A3A9Z9B4_9ACTN|nr:NAD-dependent epimerase/dehydratase family protein [Streptomyces hoynatensis]RKN44853.1 NAD-dependent epimerase/dehydratase family protein [Streptomyces hoynatensis]
MRIFLTGATGYIGGSLAVRLAGAGHEVTGLARTGGKARALAERGITPIRGDLDDGPALASAARAADAVINAADSDHRPAVEALLAALEGTGKALLHTSGSSIVGDDARGERSERVFTEADVAPGSPWRPEPDKAPRVALDRLVLAAADRGVRSVVLCNSLVYGHGRGIARDSVQLPRLARQARSSGVARHVGPGRNIWSTVHIDDVAELYALALEAAPAGAFYFVENGEASFGELTQAIADALGCGRAQAWDIEDAIREWGFEPAVYALGSNSRVRGLRARRELGWQPRHPSAVRWVRDRLTSDQDG